MMRKMLLAAALSVTAMTAHADYQCSVTPRDDVIVSPQTVQVKGENGNLVITPDGNVMYNGKQYSLNAAQREQAKDYQAELRSTLIILRMPPSARRRRLIRLHSVAPCRGLMKARKAASKKPVLRWIKLSFRRWAKAAKCAAV